MKPLLSKQIGVITLAAGIAFSGMAAHAQYGQPQGPPRGYGSYENSLRWQNGAGRQWDASLPQFRDAARQGYRDGIYGAQKDVENRRRPNVNNRDEFRNPHVDRPFRRDYRMGFERGYDNAMQHMLEDRYGYR